MKIPFVCSDYLQLIICRMACSYFRYELDGVPCVIQPNVGKSKYTRDIGLVLATLLGQLSAPKHLCGVDRFGIHSARLGPLTAQRVGSEGAITHLQTNFIETRSHGVL